MPSLNKVLLIGHLGADPEAVQTKSGLRVVKFNLATSFSFKKKDGEATKDTQWHKIVTFGKTAENCASYMVKGDLVYVEGRIKTTRYETKNGDYRFITEIIAASAMRIGKPRNTSSGDESAAVALPGNDISIFGVNSKEEPKDIPF